MRVTQNDIERYQKNDFRHFNSVSEFAAAAAVAAEEFLKTYRVRDEWAGGTLDDARRYCERGDVAAVPEASKIADMINDAVDIAGAASTWGLDVMGAFPSVPDYLAGDPASMWTKTDDSSTRGIIDVWFDMGVSCVVSAENMRRRGVCVLALLLALQRVRNVRAHLYTAHIAGNFTMDFSYPFDVSELAAFCGQPVITRRLNYALCETTEARTVRAKNAYVAVAFASWCERRTGNRQTEIDALKQYAGLGRDGVQTLVINSNRAGDLAKMTDRDYINFLNGIISRVNDGGNLETI